MSDGHKFIGGVLCDEDGEAYVHPRATPPRANNTLPALIGEANYIAQMLLESGGEITPEIESLIDRNGVELSAKVDAYWFVIQDMEAKAAYAAERSKKWVAASKAYESAIHNMEARLLIGMQALEIKEISGSEVSFRRQSNPPSCHIDDRTILPSHYVTIETPEPVTKIDKKRIIEDLKLGVPVPGARLERTERIVSRVATSTKVTKS